jgi:hypothetical protein
MADPRMDDEPAIPEVVRWIADEVTAVLFDGIVAEIIADDLCVAAGKLLQLRYMPQARQAPGLQLTGPLAGNAEHGGGFGERSWLGTVQSVVERDDLGLRRGST